jgi:phage anti-repressor protein
VKDEPVEGEITQDNVINKAMNAVLDRVEDQEKELESLKRKYEPVEPTTPEKFSIGIYIRNIGNDDVNAVNARELWMKLKVTTKFADWIKRRIDEYDFKQDFDFCVLKNENGESRGFQPTDYFISLDMAKELSMVENNDEGKQARRYFIECEKKAHEKTAQIEPPTKHTKPLLIITPRHLSR